MCPCVDLPGLQAEAGGEENDISLEEFSGEAASSGTADIPMIAVKKEEQNQDEVSWGGSDAEQDAATILHPSEEGIEPPIPVYQKYVTANAFALVLAQILGGDVVEVARILRSERAREKSAKHLFASRCSRERRMNTRTLTP